MLGNNNNSMLVYARMHVVPNSLRECEHRMVKISSHCINKMCISQRPKSQSVSYANVYMIDYTNCIVLPIINKDQGFINQDTHCRLEKFGESFENRQMCKSSALTWERNVPYRTFSMFVCMSKSLNILLCIVSLSWQAKNNGTSKKALNWPRAEECRL